MQLYSNSSTFFVEGVPIDFWTFKGGAYSTGSLIRERALIRIYTVHSYKTRNVSSNQFRYVGGRKTIVS